MRIVIQEMFSYLCHNSGTGQGISRTSAISVQLSAKTKTYQTWSKKIDLLE
jgi:hypothetical protein